MGNIFLIAGVCIRGRFRKKSLIGENLRYDDAKICISNGRENQAALQKKENEEISILEKNIKKAENKIQRINDEIALCERYLSLGQAKIADYWFSSTYKPSDGRAPFDSTFTEYRDASPGQGRGRNH